MARSNVSFGHRCLIGGVVRGRTYEAGGRGSSASGREACVFRAKKSRDFARPCGYPVESLPPYFFSHFLGFLETESAVM
jgi:hypothetical protein